MLRIPTRIDSTFRYVLLSARRAEQLMRGARPRVEGGSPKATRVALREISEDLVEWNYGPPPAPPAAPPAETDAFGEAAPAE